MVSSSSDSGPSPSRFSAARHMKTRTQSFSSDRHSVSTTSHGLLTPPLSISPAAAFITETAASQIIMNNHESNASNWYDQHSVEPAGEAVVVSSAALDLINGFLDQLLFNFLQVAKSTSLAALRPAVSEILKPKLARDTIQNADEELREYLGDADEDDYVQPGDEHDWDLELAWKRARLRCMVYSSLGDLEEEDEDMFMQQENLEVRANENTADAISAAVAIFLTSVIEYMGELTLIVAGQSAYQRVQSKIEKQIQSGSRNPNDRADRIVIDEMDMERVAFDRTLGRLWRAWKKRLRGPTAEFQNRPHSGDSVDPGESHGCKSDASSVHQKPNHLDDTIVEHVHPADIPLPIGDNDIAEIEVPGLVHYSDDEDDVNNDGESEESREECPCTPGRPLSLDAGLDATPSLDGGSRSAVKAGRHHAILMPPRRSNSMPNSESLAFKQNALRLKRKENTANGRTGPVSQIFPSIPAKSRLRTSTTASKTKRSGASPSDSDDPLEHATYEKAEIVKSSRVSVASFSSRSFSESSGAMSNRRASTDHSARIIDVPAPKSPAHSQRYSLDAADRIRLANASGSSSRAQSFTNEEPRKTKASDSASRASLGNAATRSPVDKMRPSLQSASTISESEEEPEDRPAKTPAAVHAASAARSKDLMSRVPYALQTSLGQYDRIVSSPKIDQMTPNTKSSILRNISSGSAFIEEGLVDSPRKLAAAKGLISAERVKDEEMAASQTSVVPPRPTHTSGSCSSSGNGRPKAFRSSEESSARAECVARNFEELIQSNQTISYTLTPMNMRDINVKPPLESPAVSKMARKSEDLRGPSIEGTGSPLTRRANPAASPVSLSESDFNKFGGAMTRVPTGASASSNWMMGSQARDARVPGESLAGLAEFIKSTGPAGNTKVPPPLRTTPVPSSPVKVDSISRRISVASNRSNQSNHSIGRNRYQPRDPVTDLQTDSSDLIEFIRQGPPSAMGSQHRIPRHVAPFRNTMDSEQFSGLGGRAVDAVLPDIRYSQASASFTENSVPSMQSFHSNSALLKNGGPGYGSKTSVDEDMMMPVRKTRRVRDPYAIDLSDEEEDDYNEFGAPSAAPPKKEESLAEFLRNYQPPPQPEPRSTAKAAAAVKKKTSSPSLMGRFSRSAKDAKDGGAGKEAPPPSGRISSPANIFSPSGGGETRSLNSRTGNSKHIPLVVNMPPGYDMYGPIPGYADSADAATTSRVTMKKFEPRDPVALGETSELAHFLRTAAPPPGHDLPPILAHQGDSNGLSKVLGRRRKAGLI